MLVCAWYVLGAHLSTIWVGRQALDQAVPEPELLPLARVVNCFEEQRLLVSIFGPSPSLVRVLDDKRGDGHRFLILEPLDGCVSTMFQAVA